MSIVAFAGLLWAALAGLACAVCASAARDGAALADADLEPGPMPSAPVVVVAGGGAQTGLLHDLAGHDAFTRQHSERVARLARAVGSRMGLGTPALAALERAATLHDVGKIRVPDEILRKPGRLDDDEWALMARHPEWGVELLEEIVGHGDALAAVRSHHERFDGRGYPDGLAATDIPLMARIIGACDAYDAMTSARPYQPTRTRADALREILHCSGTQFDPRVVEALEAAVRCGSDLAGARLRTATGRRRRFRTRRWSDPPAAALRALIR